MEELKKCPFCEGEARYYRFAHKNVVYCTKCGVKMERSYGSQRDVINAWNHRIEDK